MSYWSTKKYLLLDCLELYSSLSRWWVLGHESQILIATAFPNNLWDLVALHYSDDPPGWKKLPYSSWIFNRPGEEAESCLWS